ncbi:carbohydrate kinase family protein [Paenibacillus sp. NPDC058174]|uniref:carbohydrate kinase family protein n=1 Tax=Paenibacillus sp. NPDC058174 TaxID=3346366 RepID=UPI0036D9E6E1
MKAEKPYDVLLLGAGNIDIVVSGCNAIPDAGQEIRVPNISFHIGGGTALSGLGMAKLGMRPVITGIVGDDYCGRFIIDELNRNGVATDIAFSQKQSTGISVAFNPETDRSFVTYDGTVTEFTLNDVQEQLFTKVRHVHITGYNGRSNHEEYLSFVTKAKQSGLTVSMDVGWDETGEWYEGIFDIIPFVDVFFANELEAIHYSRQSDVQAALSVFAKHTPSAVIKLGEGGVIAERNGKMMHHPSFQVTVVDTTGAGDSFNAGYLYGYLKGDDLENCLLYGTACGSLSVTKRGGSAGSPDLAELTAFLSDHSPREAVTLLS